MFRVVRRTARNPASRSPMPVGTSLACQAVYVFSDKGLLISMSIPNGCQGNRRSAGRSRVLFLAVALLAAGRLPATDGHVMHGAGPVNESIGGAGTGACLDATGSIAWNPACTVTFEGTFLDGAFEYFVPFRSLSSSVGANAFGVGFPAQSMFGVTQSATNAGAMPSFAFVKHGPKSRNAYHMGLVSVAGFGVDYPQDNTFHNAILTPQAPAGMGFGAIDSSYAMMKVPIGISRMVTSRLAIGVSVVPALSMLKVAPAPFAAPVSIGGGAAQYLSASNTSKAAGIGGDVGVHYQLGRTVSLGAAWHSPMRFAAFQWNALDASNQPHTVRFRMDMPQFVTMGIGVTPAAGTLLAADVRWINYANTQGFAASGFNPDGSVAGFGWRNIWTAGGGVQQRVARKYFLRLGYNYSQNPIPAALSFFNTPAPAIVQHHITAGLTKVLSPRLAIHLVYYHVFENHETGPYMGPQGPMANASVTNQLAENSFAVGFTRHL